MVISKFKKEIPSTHIFILLFLYAIMFFLIINIVLAGSYNNINHPNATPLTTGQNTTGQIGNLDNLTMSGQYVDYCLTNICNTPINTTEFKTIFRFDNSPNGAIAPANGVLAGPTSYNSTTTIFDQSLRIEYTTLSGNWTVDLASDANQKANISGLSSWGIGGWFWRNTSGHYFSEKYEPGGAASIWYFHSTELIYKNSTGQSASVSVSNTLNTWKHIYLRNNGTNLCPFVDGTIGTCVASIGPLANYVSVMAYSPGASLGGVMFIDEIIINNISLTNTQIRELYEAGVHQTNPDKFYSNQSICKWWVGNATGTYLAKSQTLGYNITSCSFVAADNSSMFISGNNVTAEFTPINDIETGIPINSTTVFIVGNTTQFIIQAWGGSKNVSLTIFNAIINGTNYSTTNGTIGTPYYSSTSNPLNITVQAQNFLNGIWNPILANGTLNANLSQVLLTGLSTTITNGTWLVGETVNTTCSFTNPTGLTVTRTYYINNTNDVRRQNFTTNNYSLRDIDTMDTVLFGCFLDTTYEVQRTPEINNSLNIDKFFYLYGYNYLNVLLTSINWTLPDYNRSSSANPYSLLASVIYSNSNNSRTINVTVNLTDLTSYNRFTQFRINITETTTNYNYSPAPNQLVLSFEKVSVAANTSGYISDMNKTLNWTNSSLVVIQQNLTTGYVHVRFGLVNGVNATQYYDYINDNSTHLIDTLQILNQSNWYTFLQVLDNGGNPIKDATIRAFFSLNDAVNPTWSYQRLFGQRLTDDEGLAFFFEDLRSEVKFIVSKNGYVPQEVLMTIGDESFTRASPYKIYLTQSTVATVENAWIYIPASFSNRTQNIPLILTAIGRNKIEFLTSFASDTGYSRTDVTNTCDSLDRCTITLRSGTDFATTGTANISTWIYLDNVLWKNITIPYGDGNFTTIVPRDTITSIDSDIKNPVAYIIAILIATALGITFKEDKVATTSFKIFILIISFLIPAFMWVSGIFIFSLAAKALRRIVSE